MTARIAMPVRHRGNENLRPLILIQSSSNFRRRRPGAFLVALIYDHDVGQIERGYEHIHVRLNALGAAIERIEE